MTEPNALLGLIALLGFLPLHGASTPVPHWAVLLVVVPSLWLVIGGGAIAVDRLLGHLVS